MKLTFLGVGSALSQAFNSNAMLEINGQNLLIDAGADIKHSLRASHFTEANLDAVYISHLHFDHCGGVEYLAFKLLFDEPRRRLSLFGDRIVLESLEKALSYTAVYDKNIKPTLHEYFNVIKLSNHPFKFQDTEFELVPTIHPLPTYGLTWVVKSRRYYFTSDGKFDPTNKLYEEADVIFQDCQTAGVPNDSHAHYNQLLTLPDKIRSKMWLYHYQNTKLPNTDKDGFMGFVVQGHQFLLG